MAESSVEAIHQPVIAIIGAGIAGREFAGLCAAAGFQVILEDVMPERLRHAETSFEHLTGTMKLSSTVEDAVRDADFVVDFVPDELESKLEIWSLIDRMAPPRTILCTPSEVLSITDLASCTYRGDRCVMVRGDLGGHGEVRVLTAVLTSEATRDVAQRVFCELGHSVIVASDPDLPQLLKNMSATEL